MKRNKPPRPKKRTKTFIQSSQNLLLTAAAVFAGLSLLIFPDTVSEGAKTGLSLCCTVIIPSLFPFMVLGSFIALTPVGQIIAKPFGWIFRRLYRLPPQLAPIAVMSFIGGYPVAANAISMQLKEGHIHPRHASYALTFCVNAAPSFLIGSVGAAMLGSQLIGLLLFLAQLLSALLCGFVFCRRLPRQETSSMGDLPRMGTASAFVQAVTSSANAIVITCAFVILFSAISALLKEVGLFPALGALLTNLSGGRVNPHSVSALLTGLLEVTSGCYAAAHLPASQFSYVIPFICAFSGISILCQVSSFFQRGKVNLRPFLLSRLLHGALTTFFFRLFSSFISPAADVLASLTTPVGKAPDSMVASCICLIGMCSILLYATFEPRQKGNG